MTYLFLLLTVFAVIYKFFPPKKINVFYSYRTANSMKSLDNWNLANKYAANVMLHLMLLLLIVSGIFDLIAFEGKNWLLGLSILSFIVLIYFTEKKIKQHEGAK